jgi:hypothetical protein
MIAQETIAGQQEVGGAETPNTSPDDTTNSPLPPNNALPEMDLSDVQDKVIQHVSRTDLLDDVLDKLDNPDTIEEEKPIIDKETQKVDLKKIQIENEALSSFIKTEKIQIDPAKANDLDKMFKSYYDKMYKEKLTTKDNELNTLKAERKEFVLKNSLLEKGYSISGEQKEDILALTKGDYSVDKVISAATKLGIKPNGFQAQAPVQQKVINPNFNPVISEKIAPPVLSQTITPPKTSLFNQGDFTRRGR